MPLPISRSQVNKLGQRLTAPDACSDEDLAQLENVLTVYAGVVADACQILDVLENGGFKDVSITGRAKTTQTTLEKLARNKSRLSAIEDLAGVRIVADITLSEQDALVDLVRGLFGGAAHCRVIDRRTDPRAGYRAVHVVAALDKMPLEIQVRTKCQDEWANLFEAAADAFGRGIRYGEYPIPTSDAELNAEISNIVMRSVKISDSIYAEELRIDRLDTDDRPSLDVLRDCLADLTRSVSELKGVLRRLTDEGP